MIYPETDTGRNISKINININIECFREVLKVERFGGICDYINEDKFSNKNESIIWQKEDCKICKEHCPGKATPDENKIINWPAMPYPGNDPACIGYCPSEYQEIYVSQRQNKNKSCSYGCLFPPPQKKGKIMSNKGGR